MRQPKDLSPKIGPDDYVIRAVPSYEKRRADALAWEEKRKRLFARMAEEEARILQSRAEAAREESSLSKSEARDEG